MHYINVIILFLPILTFLIEVYNVTYNLNNGTIDNAKLTTYTVETPTFNFITPTRNGYTFDGWYTSKSGSESSVIGITTGSTGDLTIYAKWEADYKYTENENKVNIIKYIGHNSSVIIPPTIDGYSVTSIGNDAFSWCSKLESLTISTTSSLKSIGDGAFIGCEALTKITIPDSVTSIGMSAFADCSTLESVTISTTSSLDIVDYETFSNCIALTKITIPDSVNDIYELAFYNCSTLESVTISITSSLDSISTGAFVNCVKLKSIAIPKSTHLDDTAFDEGCSISRYPPLT